MMNDETLYAMIGCETPDTQWLEAVDRTITLLEMVERVQGVPLAIEDDVEYERRRGGERC